MDRNLAIILVLFLGSSFAWAGTLHEVRYEPSADAEGLQIGVTYKLWVPATEEPLRGIIIHQHGCGVGASQGGQTAALDLHWQALARKWNCALLGPSFHVEEDTDCRLWCDPRNGSADRLVEALGDLAKASNRPEVATVPWCLWGHSGGGFWASLMQMLYPERIVAIWFQSGTAYSRWVSGEIEALEIPETAMQIPMVANPGVKERDHERFHTAWNGSLDMVKAYRAKGAPIAFAPDPRTGHECGDSRYLAIPFFDVCLEQRLPGPGTTKLRLMDGERAWLAPHLGTEAVAAKAYDGDPAEMSWLPSERIAKAWEEFVATGGVSDSTPPEAPSQPRLKGLEDGSLEISWDAVADFESGIGGFIIQRDGVEIARIPAEPKSRFGRPLFQGMSYHDTPVPDPPQMRYVDKSPGDSYRVITINSVELLSEPSEPASMSPQF